MKVNRTVDRAINMLELISNHKEGLTLNEICEKMDIPKSSGFDILHTLANQNMIEAIGRDSKVYRIGVKTFVIGNQYMEGKRVVDIARSGMEKIGDKYAKSVFLGEDNLGNVVYVHKYQPKMSPIVASCKIGSTNAYYNTALGKCMLAFREDCIERIEEFYKDGIITDKDKFLKEITRIRQNKYVFSDQEHEKQLFCVAVPIFDHRGSVSYAISLSGLYSSQKECMDEALDLKNIACEISKELGYRDAIITY